MRLSAQEKIMYDKDQEDLRNYRTQESELSRRYQHMVQVNKILKEERDNLLEENSTLLRIQSLIPIVGILNGKNFQEDLEIQKKLKIIIHDHLDTLLTVKEPEE